MKQRILVTVACFVLAALILLLLPPSANDPVVSTGPTVPPHTNPNTTPPSSNATLPPAGGAVRLYSCDEGVRAVFTELAAEYSTLTGLEVTVLGPGEDDCQAGLQRYMESENPPTVLCIHSQSQLKSWQDSLLDLGNTGLAEMLCNDGLGMRLDGKLLGIPMAVEGYGLLFNAELLASKGALSRNDIFDLSSLTTAVQILKNNSVKAFPSATFTLQDAWYLLMSGDLDSARALIDLQLANGNKTGNPKQLFLDGKAAFCLGGSWDYDSLASAAGSALHVRNLDILPSYAAGAMQYVCSTVWCVNADTSEDNIRATLHFLKWMVTAGEDTPAPVDRLETLTPFADGSWYANQLEKKLRYYMQTETVVLQWKETTTVANRLLLALTDYVNDSTETNWEAVCRTAEQIKLENGYVS